MTHRTSARLSKLSLALVMALAAAPAFAQSTSSGVTGQVVGADGQPVAGADVTITHVDSGTTSRVTTDASGRYNARGLRVGGPYTITVTKAGAGTDTENNVFLSLNQVSTIDASLNADITTLQSVAVVGTAGVDDLDARVDLGGGRQQPLQQHLRGRHVPGRPLRPQRQRHALHRHPDLGRHHRRL